MTLNVSYPGVYLSETGTSTISIQNGQTIVPLFVIDNGSFPTKMPISSDGMCFYNFKEVCEYGNHAGYLYYRSLSGWFDCGGGKCYLAQLKDIENVAKKWMKLI